MPTVLVSLSALGLAATALAHDPELELKYRLEAKLKMPWVRDNGFTTDYDKALKASTESGKPIFAYFTLSYRDIPACGKVESMVLATPEFKKFGEIVVLFTHIDSGLGGKHADLLHEKGGLEVPYFLVMDGQGRATAKVTGGLNVEGFEKAVKAGAEFEVLKSRTDKTADEMVHVVTQDMDLGNLKLPLAKERIAGLGPLSEAQKKQVAEALLRLEVWTAASIASGSLEATRAAGKLFAEMWAAGRVPTTDEHVRPFFTLMLDHAESTTDAKLFSRALAELKKHFADRPDLRAFLDWQDERLKLLDGGREGTGDKEGGEEAR